MTTLTDPYLNDVRLRIAITMGWFGDPVLEKPENADEIAKRVAKAGNILTDSERDAFLLAYRPGLDWGDVTNSYNSQRGGAAKRQTVMHHAASAERKIIRVVANPGFLGSDADLYSWLMPQYKVDRR